MVIALMMVPGILTLLPRFMLIYKFGLLNTYWALILPYISGNQVFQTFVLRTFFASLPQELFEAAKIDGAGELRVYSTIAIPLSKPILGTLAILVSRGVWNDLIWPRIVLIDATMRTITAALSTYMPGDAGGVPAYGARFAGYILASLPLLILFAFTMKQFMAGLTSGALKM